MGIVNEPMHENARGMDLVGIDFPGRDDDFGFSDGDPAAWPPGD